MCPNKKRQEKSKHKKTGGLMRTGGFSMFFIFEFPKLIDNRNNVVHPL